MTLWRRLAVAGLVGAVASALAAVAIQEFKELRPFYFGDFYSLFEVGMSEETWSGWQFDRPDLGAGIVVVLRRSLCLSREVTLGLKAIDPSSNYEVELLENYETLSKNRMSGAELARLEVQIKSAPGSRLIKYMKMPR